MKSIFACVYLLATFTGREVSCDDPIVSTNLGRIKGTRLESRLGQHFHAFRGIRYAEPPIGDLRFQAPQPVKPWTGTFDATIDGPMCPQPDHNISEISEDCLRLNVYTKNLGASEKKPVLIYIHPGGFYALSGQSTTFAGPQSLMDRDIVFVAINYRLGSLGFMSTGTKDCPGNAGFKDQVLAFKWIRDHISNFGGDPNSVTQMGYSAGSMSTTLHLISPMSRNLFHKAIIMSASATSQWEVPEHQLFLAERQAEIFECPKSPIPEMVKCLKDVPAKNFGDNLKKMFDFSYNPVLLWTPIVEKYFGQERFLVENPTVAYKRGNFMRIPIMAGVTRDEFANSAVGELNYLFLSLFYNFCDILEILTNETLKQKLNENFEELAPILFLYERQTDRSKNITQLLRQKFLGTEDLTEENSLQGLNYVRKI